VDPGGDAQDRTSRAVAAQPPRLPEDPQAGERSHQQWLAQMQVEERERQLGFDRRKMKDHRALIAVLSATRARYDAARTPAAVEKVQSRTPALADQVGKRITAIDHWGVNSRLLGDYRAWLAALSDTYPAAVKAALNGDRRALADARADMDRRLATIHEWLKAAADSEDE
jgi:hypothetical protein